MILFYIYLDMFKYQISEAIARQNIEKIDYLTHSLTGIERNGCNRSIEKKNSNNN